MIKIIIVEDDKDVSKILANYLGRYAMDVTCFDDPEAALTSLEMDKYDLMVLDLSLPNIDGLDVCKIVREKYKLPIIISSARSDVSDKVVALELGADDYLPKPYDNRELVARIQSLFRRVTESNDKKMSEFIINADKMIITHNNTHLDLTLAEFEILKLFLENKQKVLSREYIANNADSIKWDSIDKSIDVIVGRIRNKLGDSPKISKYIKSIRGVGYKFIGD